MILAPVIVGRKGENLDLFDDLRAQGFIRVRVDGEVYEIDSLPKLDKNKKHTIEVVIDRLKVREDMKQRLAESFETALRHAEGRAIAWRWIAVRSTGSRPSLPARCAATACRSWSRACSPSTTRWVPAPSVMAWVKSPFSTPSAWWRTRN
jgi:excinuclease UvrABC ATPase subunit